jgi:NADH-quinone oxidoreductase subunit N
MSFLAIYLTVSLVLILLINSLTLILNKSPYTQVSSSLYPVVSRDDTPTTERALRALRALSVKDVKGVESGYGSALMIALSLILVSPSAPSLLGMQGNTSLMNFSLFIIYLLLLITIIIINVVKPSALNESALLISFSTLGLILMITTSHLIGLYLGVELYSLSAYILASGGALGALSSSNLPFNRNKDTNDGYIEEYQSTYAKANKPSVSAGLKYFLLSALSSGVLVAGISIVYACTGELTINGLSRVLCMETECSNVGSYNSSLKTFTMLGLGLIISTLMFKIGAAPFHFWVPDVYSKVSLFVNFYLISVPKIGILYTLIKIVLILPISTAFARLILISSILSLIVGALGGLVQIKTTRLLAYSSISHAGYILLALYAAYMPHHTDVFNSGQGAPSPMHIYSIGLYLFIYCLMTVNMFTILYCVYLNDNKVEGALGAHSPLKVKYIWGLKGMSSLNPFLAASMAVTLLSMAGVPPLAGFVAKLSVYMAILDSGALIPAVFAVLFSVVTAVYYLRLIKVAYFYSPERAFSALKAKKALGALSVKSNKENSVKITHASSIVISISTLLIIFFPILKPSVIFLYLS